MELHSKYRIKNGIKFRREKFGGLIYDHKIGSLQFVHSHLISSFLLNDGSYTVAEMAERIAPGKIKGKTLEHVLAHLKKFQERGVIDEL